MDFLGHINWISREPLPCVLYCTLSRLVVRALITLFPSSTSDQSIVSSVISWYPSSYSRLVKTADRLVSGDDAAGELIC